MIFVTETFRVFRDHLAILAPQVKMVNQVLKVRQEFRAHKELEEKEVSQEKEDLLVNLDCRVLKEEQGHRELMGLQ